MASIPMGRPEVVLVESMTQALYSRQAARKLQGRGVVPELATDGVRGDPVDGDTFSRVQATRSSIVSLSLP